MKAPTWRRRVRVATVALPLLLGISAHANTPAPGMFGSLPEGLPALPDIGETMQRNQRSGLALNGFDPVAYRVDGKPTPGRADFELVHDGIVWRFASAANRAVFEDAPSIYAPAFDGLDAHGVADGRAVDADPATFAVIGSRLFLFRSQANRAAFVADAELRARADTQWREVSTQLAR